MPYTPSGPFNLPVGAWRHNRNIVANYPGPFRRAGDIYAVLTGPATEASVFMRVARSTDQGVTWASQDEAAMPEMAFYNISAELLNADTIRLGYADFPSFADIILRDFDLVTNTLGPPVVTLPRPLWGQWFKGYNRNPVVSQDWIYASVRAVIPLFGTKLVLCRHDGSGFLADIEVSDNILAPATKTCLLEGLFMDSTGTNHVLYSESPLGGPGYVPRTVYYRQISSAGVMTAPVVVYTYTLGDAGSTNEAAFGFAALAGNRLIWPFPKENGTTGADAYYTPCTLVIDPYTDPAPVITQVDIPGQRLIPVGTFSDVGSIHAVSFGADAYLWWAELGGADGVTPYDRIMYQLYNGVGVPGPGTVFHDELADPTPWAPPACPIYWLSPPWMDAVDPMMFLALYGAGEAFMGIGVPPPPVVTARGGQGYRQPICKPPNAFDCCLMVDAEQARRVPKRRMCQMPQEKEGLKWVQAPPGSLRFRKVGTIPTPLAIAGDVPVLEFEVPTGYDGVIRGQAHRYTGPGFREGGGDIEWRVKIGRVYTKHLGNVKVSMGRIGQPWPVRDGIPLSSQQRVQYIVAVPNFSGGILPVNTRIVCELIGWFTPRR